MSPVRVLIVDDHEVVRMGLRAVLQPEADLAVVGEAGDAAQALREAERAHPEVVLMDVRMPGVDGIETCRRMRELLPRTRVIMLTSYADNEAVLSSILAGASGYLLKNAGRADLLRAVRAVAKGESLLDPAITAGVIGKIKELSAREDPLVAQLSEREREVLVLVAQGKTNKEIAERLIISDNTALNHVSHIFEKLGISRRSEAATFASLHGLLPKN